MFVVTLANFFAIILSFTGRLIKKEKLCFLLAIIFLILFYSIRTNYGNDLPDYQTTFDRISNFTINDLEDKNGERIEPGWIVLNYIFAPLGWQAFLFVLTAFQFYSVYWLITKYGEPKYYWIIFTLYVLNSNLLLTDLSMLRQAFCMHACCWIIPWILEKKIIKAGVIIIGLSTIHTSALSLFILLAIPYLCKINHNVILISFLILFLLLLLVEDIVGESFKMLFESEIFEKYQVYEGVDGLNGVGMGVIFKVVTCCWLLKFYSKTYINKFFIIALSFGILIIPFGSVVALIARIGMYFNLISLPAYQNLAKSKRDNVAFLLLLLEILINLSGYISFFESPIYKPYFSVYHTIFD